MPIYAYKCESCGHRQDVLQKMSDPLLTVCPACGKGTYVKQVTAGGCGQGCGCAGGPGLRVFGRRLGRWFIGFLRLFR